MSNAITLVGKVNIFTGGKKETRFRDSNGDQHADFYTASIGFVAGNKIIVGGKELDSIGSEARKDLDLKEGEFYSMRWNVSADDAECIANAPMGTVYRVLVTPKTKVNAAGVKVLRWYESTLEVTCHDIEVVKEGNIARRRYQQFLVNPRTDAGEDTDTEDSAVNAVNAVNA